VEKKILVPNAAQLIESMRSIGYSFETAVADIIDNSLFADAKNIYISFDVFNLNPYFLIFDDGKGMTTSELESAMVYGAKNPNDIRDPKDLGRFGLGLKSASLSQCRELIVISKKEKMLSAYSWDLDFVISQDEWAVKKLSVSEINNLGLNEIDDLSELESGTIVLWRNFDRINLDKERLKKDFIKNIAILEEHLALVFHRYMDGDFKTINMYINNNKITPIDPFLQNNNSTTKKPIQPIDVLGEKVEAKPFVLPHLNRISIDEMAMLGGKENLRGSQGYYIYRNKRLIIWGKWFGQYPKNELQKLVRVRVDIPNSLDYLWEIDVKKSQAVLPRIIKKNLGLSINKALEDGKNVFHYRGRKQSQLNIEYIWDRISDRGKISYQINMNHPLIVSILNELQDENKIKTLFKLIADYLPIHQIYNDQADSKKIINNDNNSESIEKARFLLKFFTYDEAVEILKNPSKIEGLNLRDNEILILKKEYDINE
jgi:hypothetical protein